jgi:hypothetical protein
LQQLVPSFRWSSDSALARTRSVPDDDQQAQFQKMAQGTKSVDHHLNTIEPEPTFVGIGSTRLANDCFASSRARAVSRSLTSFMVAGEAVIARLETCCD